jgi:hypothetical protein
MNTDTSQVERSNVMTNTQAVQIAELAVKCYDARKDLAESEQKGSYLVARERRQNLASAEAELNAAIAAAVER